jgi:hypothetical protein
MSPTGKETDFTPTPFHNGTRTADLVSVEALAQSLDEAFETRVGCPVHFSHAAGTERADDLVGAEASAGGESQGRSDDYWGSL